MVRQATADERTPRTIVPRVAPVSLVGDRTANALAPTLRRVCLDHGRNLTVSTLVRFAAQAVPHGSVVVLADLPLEVVLAAAPEVQRAGGRTLVVPPFAHSVPRAAAEQLQRANATLVPVQRLRLPMTPDGKSPSAAGYATLAGAIWTYLR